MKTFQDLPNPSDTSSASICSGSSEMTPMAASFSLSPTFSGEPVSQLASAAREHHASSMSSMAPEQPSYLTMALASSSSYSSSHTLPQCETISRTRQSLQRMTHLNGFHAMTATPNHALQRTGAAVTAPASCLRLSPAVQGPRQPPRSLSLESLAVATRHLRSES